MQHLTIHTPPSNTTCYQVNDTFRFDAKNVIGKTILVTGAANGIGKALAMTLGRAGADLILLDKNEKGLDALSDALAGEGVKKVPLLIPLDLTKLTEDIAAQLAEQLNSSYTKIDGLAHIAGILGELTPLSQYPPFLWRQVWTTHVDATFLLTQALTPLLRAAPQAQVIFTTADEGLLPRAYWGAYAISKSALQALAEVWAAEWLNTSAMRINSVNPGPVATEQRRQAFPAEDITQIPQPDQSLNSYLYLLSAADPSLTGAVLLPSAPKTDDHTAKTL